MWTIHLTAAGTRGNEKLGRLLRCERRAESDVPLTLTQVAGDPLYRVGNPMVKSRPTQNKAPWSERARKRAETGAPHGGEGAQVNQPRAPWRRPDIAGIVPGRRRMRGEMRSRQKKRKKKASNSALKRGIRNQRHPDSNSHSTPAQPQLVLQTAVDSVAHFQLVDTARPSSLCRARRLPLAALFEPLMMKTMLSAILASHLLVSQAHNPAVELVFGEAGFSHADRPAAAARAPLVFFVMSRLSDRRTASAGRGPMHLTPL